MSFPSSLPSIVLSLLFCGVLLSGCAKAKGPLEGNTPLTKFDVEDMTATLEEWSVAQASVADFGATQHPSATKPAYQKMSTLVRASCAVDVQRVLKEVRSATAKGAGCPISMHYSLVVTGLGTREQRVLEWTYGQAAGSLKDVSSIENFEFRGRQTTHRDLGTWSASGHLNSMRFGKIPVQMDGSTQAAGASGQVQTQERFTFTFPRFTATLRIESTPTGTTVAKLNGKLLANEELAVFVNLMPRLGMGTR